jgi:hypothetical protein
MLERNRSAGRPLGALILALLLATGATASPASPTIRPAAAASSWTGGVNVYRDGVFTTQKTWLWCTAAGVQIVRNMVDRDDDHSRRNQERYFDWMRGRNRYLLPVSAGVDPQGWTAGLQHFVDARYRLFAHGSFDAAIRAAAIRIRKTGLPVALAVANGNHGWILHGFSATADPLTDDGFRVTSVRVTGPLWGLQNRTSGYDMTPNKKLTITALRRFFSPWKYAPKAMIWDGRYVSIQPVTARQRVDVRAEAAPPADAGRTVPERQRRHRPAIPTFGPRRLSGPPTWWPTVP